MLKDIWQERLHLVERQLEKELKANPSLDSKLSEAMEYSLMAGGKRMRPMLLMAAADAVGGRGTDFLTAACAMEMVHTYSLIHDDLPAMDNDDYRRGKLTNHRVFGEGMAVLAGDALLTLAFEVLLRQDKAAPSVKLAVLKEFAMGAGQSGMVGGQAMDLEAEGKKISLAVLQKLHMGKTGALFHAAIRSGALLAGASDAELEALTQYADKFGLAFQITDDILDVTGDEAVIGKPVGSDERNQKSTYVTLSSLTEARELAEKTVAEAVAALEPLGKKASFLRELVEYLLERNK